MPPDVWGEPGLAAGVTGFDDQAATGTGAAQPDDLPATNTGGGAAPTPVGAGWCRSLRCPHCRVCEQRGSEPHRAGAKAPYDPFALAWTADHNLGPHPRRPRRTARGAGGRPGLRRGPAGGATTDLRDQPGRGSDRRRPVRRFERGKTG